MVSSTVAIILFVVFVTVAGLFAGAETGMYQLSRLRLRLGVEQGRLPFVLLGKCFRDPSGFLLSLLVGTNLADYMATSAMTWALLEKLGSEERVEVLTTVVAAPILFVVSELIPKNVFFYRADRLMPLIGAGLFGFHELLRRVGILWGLKRLSRLVCRLVGLPAGPPSVVASALRHPMRALLAQVPEEGGLSSVQREMFGRIVSIPKIHLRTVLVPIGQVRMLPVDSGREAVLRQMEKYGFTRWPVYEGEATNIIGYVNIYEPACCQEDFSDLRKFLKPIRRLDVGTSVGRAIRIMQREQLRIILVVRRGRGGVERPVGIATMKDLAEELLGDIAEW